MKKYIASSVVLGLAMSAMAAFAQEGASPSHSASPKPRQEKLQEIKNKVSTKKEEVKTKVAEKKQEIKDKRSERVVAFWNSMKKRLGVLIRNENNLAEKLQKRLDKASANGKDVTALNAKLATAKDLIKQASDALTAADATVADIVAKNDAKTSLEKVRDLNKDILNKIKAAHQALNEVARLVKGLGNGPKTSPSPSTSPTATPSV